MADGPTPDALDFRRILSAAESTAPVDAVDVIAGELRRGVGGRHVSLLVTNLSGTGLVRMSHVTAGPDAEDGYNERAEAIPLAGSVYEACLSRQVPDVVAVGDSWLVLAPITERGDAIGALEVALGSEPDAASVQFVAAAAHALAYVLIAARRHTDVYERAQRDVAFTLAAEIQRRLLPPAYTLEGGQFTLAGWLEPAHDVGGDTFDYALDREYLYASVTDAMGHGVEAALLATLVVGSFRNTRRTIASPRDQADAANGAMFAHGGIEQFVTGHVLRVALATGKVDFVNAGHPPPYLVRDGVALPIELEDVQPPFGITAAGYKTQAAQLQPGDRIVLLTDGYLERNAMRVNLAETLGASAHRHPRQVVRELAGHVLEATEGTLLDDATVLCIDWYGSRGERRHAAYGAEVGRASGSGC